MFSPQEGKSSLTKRFCLTRIRPIFLFLGQTPYGKCKQSNTSVRLRKKKSFILWLGSTWIISGQSRAKQRLDPALLHILSLQEAQWSIAHNSNKKLTVKTWAKPNLSTKHFSFNEKNLFRQNSLSSKNCLTELRRQNCCVFHHLRSSPSGKCICCDKGIILMCWHFTAKAYVKIFHQKCWSKLDFWLNRKKQNFQLK